jgi:hypothetical protein
MLDSHQHHHHQQHPSTHLTSATTTTTTTNQNIKRSGQSWIHNESEMMNGVTYNVKYVGAIGINESMKALSFETRTQVARYFINLKRLI